MKKRRKRNVTGAGVTVAYYFLQYLAVRCLLFGFAFVPSFGRIYSGLNIGGILSFILVLFNYFRLAISVVHIVFAFFLFVPYLFYLLWQLRNVIVYLFALYQLLLALVCYLGYVSYKNAIDLSKCVIVKCGAPGSGKSSSGLWQAVETSKKLWVELQDKYFLLSSRIDKLTKKALTIPNQLKNDWNEVRAAYEFYKNNACVPCLWTNIPVVVDGLFTNLVDRSHIAQLKRISAFTVVFLDEVGAIVSVDESRNKPLVISDFFRLCRHFGEFRIICTEQDRENVYIDIRRVVADNEQMIGQKWVLKPLLLLAVFSSLKGLFRLHRRRMRWLAPCLRFLSKTLRYLGFRAFVSVDTGNAEYAFTDSYKKRRYFLPTMLNCTYDDRTYRAGYAVKNKAIEPNIFKSLVLPAECCHLRYFHKKE
jgi:hypothetical protein